MTASPSFASPAPVPLHSYDAAIVRALHRHLSDVPGLALTDVTFRPISNDTMAVDLDLAGWSPTLHRVPLKLTTAFDRGYDADDAADTITGQLAPQIARQHRRANDAFALGHALPLRTAGEDTPIDHLLCDVAHMEMVLIGNDPDNAQSLHGLSTFLWDTAEKVANAHDRSHDGGLSLGVETVAIETDDADPRRILLLPSEELWRCPVPGEIAACDDGSVRLTIDVGPVPQAVLAAMPRRPLRDLVRVHPLLDDRLVRDIATEGFATDGSGGVIITLPPVLAPFGILRRPRETALAMLSRYATDRR